MDGITEGRIVHYVLPNGEHRAAMIVNGWHGGIGSDHLVNLHVFLDGLNDKAADLVQTSVSIYDTETIRQGWLWATSVRFDEGASTHSWHWIEKV